MPFITLADIIGFGVTWMITSSVSIFDAADKKKYSMQFNPSKKFGLSCIVGC